MTGTQQALKGQKRRNRKLLSQVQYLGSQVTSQVLPMEVDIRRLKRLSAAKVGALEGLQIEAARIAIRSLASLAEIGELDHLGGGLDLIPPLLLTMAVTDFEGIEYTIEHAHTSVGYYSCLAALGFVEERAVIEGFRRGLDIPGHVSWLPGGTQLNGGRLGVMIPTAVGQALGKRARHPKGAWVVTHCGDAGWISGQALNGFNGAHVQGAPVTFVMHRNGIQLSGATHQIMDKDPRPIVESLGVSIVEIPTLHDTAQLYLAYRECYQLAQEGKPSLIYPVGFTSTDSQPVSLQSFAQGYGITAEMKALAAENDVDPSTRVRVPGALMSFRDPRSMLECLFLVNDLPGGQGHHDGHMKGRAVDQVLANPMLQETSGQKRALTALRGKPKRVVVTASRPAPGSANLMLSAKDLAAVSLPAAGESKSPRSGSEAGYAAVAKAHPDDVFVVSCDLDASTKLGKARELLAADHQFEMSIEEQVSALMANGLAMSGPGPQLNVISTFAAFFEGIAREGFDMWRYQRNLNGVNEGLNVTYHLSHVGACTGRDHFSGWGLDWINIGLTYLPYLHRFYAPADARAAFVAVRDLAAHYGGHIIGIPRDDLPVLEKQDDSGALWEADSEWETVTVYRRHKGAKRAILAFGAPASLAGEAADKLSKGGTATDVYVVNALPLSAAQLRKLLAPYTGGVVTVEDGFIGTDETGTRGFAGLVSAAAGMPLAHVGITDPRTAPSTGHMETWAHFGITTQALVRAVKDL
jgi:transketolase